MKNKLRELERSVARIRDSSSAYERRAAEAAAELKAAALREQVGGGHGWWTSGLASQLRG